MIDNEKIEERKQRRTKRRKRLVVFESILILLLIGAVLYGILVVYPAWTDGRLDLAVPSFLRNRFAAAQSQEIQPEPTRLPTITPTPEATPSETPAPTATPTPEPEPTLAPEIEAINLPSYAAHALTDWNLILVNKDHPIPDDYVFDMVYLDEDQLFGVDVRCADDLLRMLSDCRAAGHTPDVCSAYRDVDTQASLYEEQEEEANGYWETVWDEASGTYVDVFIELPSEEGASEDDTKEGTPDVQEPSSENTADAAGDTETQDEAESDGTETEAPAVAEPGTSEHELGLAVDIYSDENIELDESQENTETQQWLMQHCWEYGFILRYPKDKSDLTGITYEPWHYRYVGTDVAQDIMESGLCLEEYIANMQKVKEAEESR